MNIIEALKANEMHPVRRSDQDFIYWKGDLKRFDEYHNNDITGEWECLLDEITIDLLDFVKIYSEIHPTNGDSSQLCKLLRKMGV